jgi:hypothetical protein
VTLMRMNEGNSVVSIAKIINEDSEEGEEIDSDVIAESDDVMETLTEE